MRICVLQSSERSGSSLQDVDDIISQSGRFTDNHTFEYRFIHKATAKDEIDALAAEKFDFYFNFMSGTLDDPVAGVLESRYFESLGLPSCGIRSWERSMNKNDFYNNARLRGRPPVPGTDRFPLSVKPANGCASQSIDKTSVCHDEKELESVLRRINEALDEARTRRTEATGVRDGKAFVETYKPTGCDSDDIVVQEYIEGQDYTCSVIQMGSGCIALTPVICRAKDTNRAERFLTLDDKTGIKVINKKEDPALFERLQQVAVEAFQVSGYGGSNMGCDVSMRVRPNGEVFAVEINPLPAAFMRKGAFQDLPIVHSLPGGHPAVVDIFIANQMLASPAQKTHLGQVAGVYDDFVRSYDTGVAQTSIPASIREIVEKHDFSGTVFDLACGTGMFGRLSANSKPTNSHLLGFDISSQMLEVCRKSGVYDHTHIESMEGALVNCHHYADSIDHIVCFTALHFLRPEVFTFFLVLCFALANKSITISVDEIPDQYNEHLVEMNLRHMHSFNHIAKMERFANVPGWKMTRGERQFSWLSPKTAVEVYTTYFRFERVGDSRGVMFKGPEFLD
ncbi:hypothetical protein BDV10DRAFT_200493 [Aspergillus recurvatus]